MAATICEKCGSSFSCGIEGQCWCAQLPAVGDPEAGSCLCPVCMKQLVIGKIAEAVSQFERGEIDNPALPYLGQNQTQSLVNGIDYYINEEGLTVFTAWYHLKRGQCCGNACHHCPYDHANVPNQQSR